MTNAKTKPNPNTKPNKSGPTVAEVKARTKAALETAGMLVKAFGAPPPRLPSANTGAAAAPQAAPVKTLRMAKEEGKTEAQQAVAAILSPSLGAALMVQDLTHPGYEQLDLVTLSWYFKEAAATAADGDLGPLQQMLAVQARALDQLLYNFLRRAGVAKTAEARDACLKIALKAQAQSRNTVESLAVIQQGPAIFARQANINQGGQQQVNNGQTAAAGAMPAQPAIGQPTIAPRVRARKAKSTNRTIGRNQDGDHG